MSQAIFLDRPANPADIGSPVVIEGWAVSTEPQHELSLSIAGALVRHHEVSRPDVEAAYPNHTVHGFMTFFEPTASTSELMIRIGECVRTFTLTASPDSLAQTHSANAARARRANLLRNLIACPACKTPSGANVSKAKWTCRCGQAYDFSNGINMIPASYPNRSSIRFQGAICSHGYDGDIEALIAETQARGGIVLDCGAGWRASIRDNVITTEILRYPSTDIVAVGEQLPFRDATFDAVLSLHVLEHVRNPFICAAELMRVLKPGGKFLAATPYIVQVHGFPYHFFNPTGDGLLTLFEPFSRDCEISVPRIAHPIVALQQLLMAYLDNMEEPAKLELSGRTISSLVRSSPEDLLASSMAQGMRPSGFERLAGNYLIRGVRAESPTRKSGNSWLPQSLWRRKEKTC
jgi:SAM-dependent methyltransferase